MSQCVKGSREWRRHLKRLREQRRAMQAGDHDAGRKAAREIARAYTAIGLESLNIKGMGASARGHGGVAAKQALNRRLRAGLWGFTQTTLANAMEAAGGVALRLPAMDSSRTDTACGRVDAGNRKGKMFRCTAYTCGRVDDADVNAARVMRQRALRWLALKSAGHSDREAAETLWEELRTARKESKRWGADRAGGDSQARVRGRRRQDAHRRRGCGVDSASGVRPTPAAARHGRSRR